MAIYVTFFAVMQYLFASSTDFTSIMELPFLGGGMGVWKGVVIAIWFGISQALIGLNVQVSSHICLYCLIYSSSIDASTLAMIRV